MSLCAEQSDEQSNYTFDFELRAGLKIQLERD